MLELNKIYSMNCLKGIKQLHDNSINCCVTSPPYWGLRDYGVEGQFGLEQTPEEYVANMVQVFREVRRVLRDDGTLWLNLGDSYANNAQAGDKVFGNPEFNKNRPSRQSTKTVKKVVPIGLKPKDLVGIPWMVAFALRADGWYLRQDIIWHKPNCMPESVKDRCTKAHEYIFLLAKSAQYYYDNEAIKEDAVSEINTEIKFGGNKYGDNDSSKFQTYSGNIYNPTSKKNKRSVWTVTTKPFKEAHFATFPPDLIKPCILAGTSPRACEICGAPWERVVERSNLNKQNVGGKLADIKKTGFRNDGNIRMGDIATKTTGWRPTCTCENEGKGRCIVLDPFMGSGTTGMVAAMYQRNFIGFELNPEYCKMAEKRIEPYLMQQTIFELLKGGQL